MTFVFFFLSLVYLSLLGFSKLYKTIILKNNDNTLSNLEVFYGIFVLIFFSNIINLILPLKYFSYALLALGLFFFLYYVITKQINLTNFLSLFIILFFLIFISSHQSPNIDSEVYHLQIINKAYSQKIVFGFANLEEKYGMTSVWQIFLGLFYINILNFKIVYFINLIPLAIFFNQAFIEINKKNSNSKNFLILASSFILLFSIIHPSNNGIILNHLGSVEVDLLCGFLFILSIYVGFKLIENYNLSDFHILFILTAIVILSKPSYIVLAIFPLIISYIIKKKLFNLTNYLLLVLLFIFFLRGFITSGCLIFPSALTCFDTFWSLDTETVSRYENIILGFARDKMRYTDFEYVIYSSDWVLPWVKNYFLKTSLLQIFIISAFISFIISIYLRLKNIKFLQFNYYLILLFLLICFLFWLRAPEVRFGFGTLISLMIFFPTIFLNIFINKFKINNFYYNIILILPLLLIMKNIQNHNYLFENYSPVFEYKYKTFFPSDLNIVQIASPNDRCVDIDKFCIYYDSKIKLKKITNYNIYYKK